MKKIYESDLDYLGIIPGSSALLHILSVEEKFKKNSSYAPPEPFPFPAIMARRYVCEDGLLFVPPDAKNKKVVVAQQLLMVSAAAVGSVVGLAALPILAGIKIKEAISQKPEKKQQLMKIAEILSFEEKDPDETIIFPGNQISEISVEKETFSLMSLSKNSYKIWLSGVAIIFGVQINDEKIWWDEEWSRSKVVEPALRSVCSNTKIVGSGGLTIDWK